jgi:DNA mismatch endonuclease, patch repair protein
MAKIRPSGTRPEEIVAASLCSARYRFTQNDPRLPGTPDFLLPRSKLAIFVHGCFWHRHHCRRGQSKPSTRPGFWNRKFSANIRRDLKAQSALRKLGYRVIVVWECQLRSPGAIRKRIQATLKKR